MMDIPINLEIKSRFEEKFRVTPSCWIWEAGKHPKGYGGFYPRHGMKVAAHRMSYLLYKGDIPKDLMVRHRCDNPSCVNPEHLELGTALDNSKDMVERGRSPIQKGETAPNAKLTDKEILEIKDLFANKIFSGTKLATLYGVSHSHIYKIANNRTRQG